MTSSIARIALALCTGCMAAGAHGYLVDIDPGPRMLYLQVGTGTIAGGTFANGGTPQNNGTINTVSVTVPPNTLGTGSIAMTSNSTVANSPYDGFNFCDVPAEVYVGGFFRRPGNGNGGGSATLSVTTPPTLVNANAETIPFTSISWLSGGNGDATPTIPSGTFSGSTQPLLSIERNTWFESCLAFTYANTEILPPGTFQGRATYTLTLP